jgi:elongation factor P
MPTIKAIDLRRGQGVMHKGAIWICQENNKVAKGNWRSSQVVKLKNLNTGQVVEDRFRTEEEFELAIIERKPVQYLYPEADNHVFMDMESFEEVRVSRTLIGEQEFFLTPNLEVTLGRMDGKPITIELPTTVTLEVVDTPPALRGATVTNAMKDAVCDTGARVKVPPFIENGTKIKVDTRNGEYVERAN